MIIEDPIAAYFTDAEDLRAAFDAARSAQVNRKKLFVLCGVGGVGKTSLLRMFRQSCRDDGMPAGMASGDGVLTAVDLLSRWAQDFATDNVSLQPFTNDLGRYVALQMKVDGKAKAEAGGRGRAATVASKVASHTAESAAGAATGAAIGSAIPGIGWLAGAIGGVAAEATIDWLHSFLSPSEVSIILDPTQRLTDSFVDSISRRARRERVILLADTLDRMAALEDWLWRLVKRLHPNVLLVVGGRQLPRWGDDWQAMAEIHNVETMPTVTVRDLVRSYYLNQVGVLPGEKQVEQIAAFAQGLPIAVTIAVHLWVRYQISYDITDFGQIEGGALAELSRFLLRDVPVDVQPGMRAAAILRYFDRASLEVVAGASISRDTFDALTQSPFVRPDKVVDEYVYRMHDRVRELLDRDLHANDRAVDRAMHLRAANYLRSQLTSEGGVPGVSDAWQRLAVEHVYHLVRGEDRSALGRLHQVFTIALRHYRFDACRTLIDDLELVHRSTPQIRHRIAYYSLRLRVAELSWPSINEGEIKRIADEGSVDPSTYAEILWFYGQSLSYVARPAEAHTQLEHSLDTLTAEGLRKTALGCELMCTIGGLEREFLGRMVAKTPRDLFVEAAAISERIADPYARYVAHLHLGHVAYADDDYVQAIDHWSIGVELARSTGNAERVADALNRLGLGLIATTRLAEAEAALDEANRAARTLPDSLGGRQGVQMWIQRHLGLWHWASGDVHEAERVLSQSAEWYRAKGSTNGLFRTLLLLAECILTSEEGQGPDRADLLVELVELGQRTGLKDWVARWEVLQGDRALRRAPASDEDADKATSHFFSALLMAAQWNAQTLDQTAARVLTSLRQGHDDGHSEVSQVVLTGIRRRWSACRIDGMPLGPIMEAARVADARRAEAISGDASFLTDRRGISRLCVVRQPNPWDGL